MRMLAAAGPQAASLLAFASGPAALVWFSRQAQQGATEAALVPAARAVFIFARMAMEAAREAAPLAELSAASTQGARLLQPLCPFVVSCLRCCPEGRQIATPAAGLAVQAAAFDFLSDEAVLCAAEALPARLGLARRLWEATSHAATGIVASAARIAQATNGGAPMPPVAQSACAHAADRAKAALAELASALPTLDARKPRAPPMYDEAARTAAKMAHPRGGGSGGAGAPLAGGNAAISPVIALRSALRAAGAYLGEAASRGGPWRDGAREAATSAWRFARMGVEGGGAGGDAALRARLEAVRVHARTAAGGDTVLSLAERAAADPPRAAAKVWHNALLCI